MKVTTILILLMIWAFEKVEAAAIPVPYAAPHFTTTTVQHPPTTTIAPKKLTLVQKLEWKLLQKKLKRQAAGKTAAQPGAGAVISSIALALAALAIILLFIPSAVGASFFLALGALVMGIVGVAGKNRSRGAKIKSIVAMILGGLVLVGWVLLIIAFAGLFGGAE